MIIWNECHHYNTTQRERELSGDEIETQMAKQKKEAYHYKNRDKPLQFIVHHTTTHTHTLKTPWKSDAFQLQPIFVAVCWFSGEYFAWMW